MTTLDLNILPIRRINGQESAEIPGLLAVTPPRKTTRGREQTSLITYLTLTGNASISDAEIIQLINDAATLFYQSSGSLTFAMRAAANDINTKLLARNLSTTGRGQYALGLLVLAAIRQNQCTLLLSGPTHAVWVTDGASRHMHDPALSGKGLGSRSKRYCLSFASRIASTGHIGFMWLLPQRLGSGPVEPASACLVGCQLS